MPAGAQGRRARSRQKTVARGEPEDEEGEEKKGGEGRRREERGGEGMGRTAAVIRLNRKLVQNTINFPATN